jgi:hypothetical protein
MIAYPSQLAKATWNLCGTTRAVPRFRFLSEVVSLFEPLVF